MSDSESSSSSSSSSESETDYEDMNEILGSIGLKKKYGRMFAKAKVVDVEDAKDLSEKKLKSIGVVSSSDRKKIMRAIENATSSDDSDSSSDSGSDEDSAELARLEKTLKANGLKKYFKVLRKGGFTDVSLLAKLDERKLKKLGVGSSEDKKKLLKLAKKSAALSKGSVVLKYLQRDTSLKRYSEIIVKEGKVTTLKQAQRLSDRQLRKLGMKSAKHREKFMKTFAKARNSSGEDESKLIARILTKAKLREHVKTFQKHDICTLERACELSSAELKEMGISTVTERHDVMKALKRGKKANSGSSSESSDDASNSGSDSDAELANEAIHKVLKQVKLEKYTSRFTTRDINSIRSAQALGHDELRDLGFDSSGQRDLIINAFQDADWKCIYCHEWNEFRSTCSNCTKKRRNVDTEAIYSLDQRVKYVGKFRPTTRIKHGDKGEIHRVLADEHYMVRIKKGERTIKIRLRQDELAAI